METIKLGTYSIHISPNIDTVMDISNKNYCFVIRVR